MAFEGAFDTFSMARSMLPFSSIDLFEKPDTIRAACETAVPLFIAIAELGTAITGIPRFLYACHRTSNDFISPAHFRDLAFPPMRQITGQLAARGITTIFHCDGCWDFNLEYLARLPEGKCVFQFDGRTDMLLARKILGGGHCIFGDVPAAMLAFGERAEVEGYCKKLIREIGAEGRFILGAGCEVPPNAKPENVRAMLRAPFDS
jgi:uroporphyrinogen-III decarboxylase